MHSTSNTSSQQHIKNARSSIKKQLKKDYIRNWLKARNTSEGSREKFIHKEVKFDYQDCLHSAELQFPRHLGGGVDQLAFYNCCLKELCRRTSLSPMKVQVCQQASSIIVHEAFLRCITPEASSRPLYNVIQSRNGSPFGPMHVTIMLCSLQTTKSLSHINLGLRRAITGVHISAAAGVIQPEL